MSERTSRISLLMLAAAVLLQSGSAGTARAAEEPAADPPAVEFRAQPVRPGLSVLLGGGGNVAVWTGEDGTVLVDDSLDRFAASLLEAVAEISPAPVRFVINTHWHPDHTGANESVARSGGVILAHDNVRTRMSATQFIEALQSESPAAPAAALPVVTFADAVSLHLNGDRLDAVHVLDAHTDGDVILWWRNANVVHMGDVWSNGRFPFIDLSSGGSLAGLVAAVELVLDRADGQTVIIPGHGPVGTHAELAAWRDMLVTVGREVRELVEQGKTEDEVLAARVTAPYDSIYGQSEFMPPEKFVRILFQDLAARPAR
jgi:glyoxylase-like metal-dependent hydrolase (beta-lactamase superfamily II)